MGSRAEEKVIPLSFGVSEMWLNLGQNIWAVLALFIPFPTHISDQKQIARLARVETQDVSYTGSTSGSDSPGDG